MKLREPFQNVLILTGPTASGKTQLALELAGPLNAEIIAMDSMTLYRGMDIGTAKPTLDERRRVPHHLIDVLDPWEGSDIAWWLKQAAAKTREIESRGKQVLFVGGTPFYLKALLCGLFESPPVDIELRIRLEDEAAVSGPVAFHEKLQRIDPLTAGRLHPNDVRRIVRAIEVYELTGKTLSFWQKQEGWSQSKPPSTGSGVIEDREPRCLALEIPRAELHVRINRRVKAMFEAGWVEEVRNLGKLDKSLGKEASQAVGYKEIREFLAGSLSLGKAKDLIQARTRQFAKRQITWFRHLPGCRQVPGKLTEALWCRKMS